MFAKIQASLSKLVGSKMVPIMLLVVAAAALMLYSSDKGNVFDQMSDGAYSDRVAPSDSRATFSGATAPAGLSTGGDPYALNGPAPPAHSAGGGNAMREVANPADLLPKDHNSQWAALNPINQGNVAMPDLLQAGYHIGLDTIGQTMKNPNLQLRSDPIIEKKSISPWNNSTTEADYARVPLELGYGGR